MYIVTFFFLLFTFQFSATILTSIPNSVFKKQKNKQTRQLWL